MSGSAFHSPLRVFSGKKTIDQTRSEGVAATNAIQDFEILSVRRSKKITLAIANRAPIISRCRRRLAECGGYYLERKILHDSLDHLFEPFRVQRRKIFFHPRYLATQPAENTSTIPKHPPTK